MVLLHAHPGITGKLFIYLDQPVQVLEPQHHFNDCLGQIKPSHVQQRGFYECGHELE